MLCELVPLDELVLGGAGAGDLAVEPAFLPGLETGGLRTVSGETATLLSNAELKYFPPKIIAIRSSPPNITTRFNVSPLILSLFLMPVHYKLIPVKISNFN